MITVSEFFLRQSLFSNIVLDFSYNVMKMFKWFILDKSSSLVTNSDAAANYDNVDIFLHNCSL